MVRWSGSLLAVAVATTLGAFPAEAQFDASKAYRESAPVAARYPAPKIVYDTPAFAAGKVDLTSQEEMVAFLKQLEAASPLLKLDLSAKSQQGRAIPVVLLSTSHDQIGSGRKPVMLILALQHGNEPAGGESALALAQRLSSGSSRPFLDKVDVVVLPRANPDGAAAFERNLANGIDPNRDHVLLRTPEIRLIGGLFSRFSPHIVLDCHEFTVGGRWLTKVGGLTKVDAMLQHATVPNLPPSLSTAAENRVLPVMRAALDREGLSHDWYFTTDGGNINAPVAMGGIGPDTGRNIAGLRHALSFLIETRGVGLGKANYLRRVHTHVTAAEAILSHMAATPDFFLDLQKQARAEVINARSEIVVAARQKAETRDLTFIDPASGEDKVAKLPWQSSLTIEPMTSRPRPAGYLIDATQSAAIESLARAGIVLHRMAAAGTINGQRYVIQSLREDDKADGRGADMSGGRIVTGTFTLREELIEIKPGDVFVPAAQPLFGLAAVLLEPESSAGVVANRIVTLQPGRDLPYARLLAMPN